MKFACFVCVVIVFLQQASAVKLNYPRVLLPIFDKLSINFTLEVVEGGCFKWYVLQSDWLSKHRFDITSNKAQLLAIAHVHE